MPTSIIIYRNPLEQAFWESGLLIPLIGSKGIFILSFVLITLVIDRYSFSLWKTRRVPTYITVLTGVISAILAVLTFNFLVS